MEEIKFRVAKVKLDGSLEEYDVTLNEQNKMSFLERVLSFFNKKHKDK